MMKAVWNGKVIAESNETIMVEGNHYFPIDAVKKEYLKESTSQTVCPWKGVASYHNLDIDGKSNKDAAWYYKDPSDLAKAVKDRIAFWKGVEITE